MSERSVGVFFSPLVKVALGLSHTNVSSFSAQPLPDLRILLFIFPLGFLVSFCPQRHTLWKRVQNMITPFLALLIAVIDRNGNLELLVRPTPEWVTKLWMFIFSDTKLLTIPYNVGKNRWAPGESSRRNWLAALRPSPPLALNPCGRLTLFVALLCCAEGGRAVLSDFRSLFFLPYLQYSWALLSSSWLAHTSYPSLEACMSCHYSLFARECLLSKS